ncbi:MAG: hypothetical protein Q8K63_04890, partial [Acidimicrobiales bacterium]|nr:hypothetical protein [Acidimicrobiales bacterium]
MADQSRLTRIKKSAEFRFLAILTTVDRRLGTAWWALLALRSAIPALFALAMGDLITSVQRGDGI